MAIRVTRRTMLAATAASAAVAAVDGLTGSPASAAPQPTAPGGGTILPFRDPSRPLQQRLDDLLGRLTLDQKIAMLHQYQPPIDALGIKLNKNGTEALHGLAWSNDFNNNGDQTYATATVFPQAVGLGQTWDPDLVRRVGDAVGREARGYHMHNPIVWGLNLWAPVVNLLRDPRWGRNEEGYSEDPYLTGAISIAYGRGIQGPDPDRLLAAPMLKHFLAYNNEARRDTCNASLRPRVLQEYDLAAFRAGIEADAATGVMTSYNLVNGRPATITDLIRSELRTWTNRDLMVVSDAYAPSNLNGAQHYYPDAAQAYGAAVAAEMDNFTQDGSSATATINNIKAALQQGLITEAEIERNARHVLSVRFRLGEFDPDGGPYAGITFDVVNAPGHQALAREAGRAQTVLLKNDGRLLPLRKSATVAVIGPLSDQIFTDFYAGLMPYRVTPVQGIGEALTGTGALRAALGVDQVAFRAPDGRYVTASASESGAQLRATATSIGPNETHDLFDWGESAFTLRARANNRYWTKSGTAAVNSAIEPYSYTPQEPASFVAQADATVSIRLGTGTNNYIVADATTGALIANGTASSATHFTRVLVQSGIDAAVAAAAGADAAVVFVGNDPLVIAKETTDRTTLDLPPAQQALLEAVHAANPKTVAVVVSSYPFAVNWAQQNIPAILHSAHAGQETGHALADVLFGDAAPVGRLSQTWYTGTDDLPDILDYDIIKGGRTYLYYQGTPLYPFGHGLTYTTFTYRNLKLNGKSTGGNGKVKVSVQVTNTGNRDGDEVVQFYTRQITSRATPPLRQLRGFRKIHIAKGRTATVEFELRARDFVLWDVTQQRWVVESADHEIMVGSSSAEIRLTERLRVHGETIPLRDLRHPTSAQTFDDYRGVTLVDRNRIKGTAVGASAGNWIKFADADLRHGVNTFSASVAKPDTTAASIQIVLDDPASGTVLGTIPVPSTGDRYAYTTVSTALASAAGRHDVYLVFTGTLNLDTFSIA